MKGLWILAIAILLTLVACQQNSSSPNIDSSESSNLTLFFPVPQQAQHLVSTAEVVISAADMDTLRAALTVTDTTVEGTIEEVPAGDNRHFEVFVYDSGNTLTYYGDAYASVIANETIVLNIVLYPENPATGTVIINGTFEEVDIVSGLVGYWPFTESAEDASGNGNHGTVYGAQLTTDAFGNPNQAYSFNGVDQYIEFGNDSILKPDLPVTISGWVLHSSVHSRVFITNYRDNQYFGVYATFGEVTGVGRVFSISYGDGGPTTSSNRRTKRVTAPEMDTWFHFTGVIRGAEDISIYINGIDAGGEYSGTGGPLAYDDGPATAGRIDSDPNGPPRYLNGSLDELRIYDRALSAADAMALYQSYF